MKILPLSDLHLEFAYSQAEVTSILDPILHFLEGEEVDVVILAGDISSKLMESEGRKRLKRCINSLLNAGDHHVIYVPGNHEFYYSSIDKTTKYLKQFAERKKNLSILQSGLVEIDGVRFIGASMWFGHDPANILHWSRMSDSICVADRLYDLECLGESEVAFILNSLAGSNCEKNVVITHFSPSHRSVPKEFKTSKMNLFFVNDCVEKELVCSDWVTTRPSLWLHGHTHSSFDYQHDILGRVVCNPFGYIGVDRNGEFDPKLVVEI